MKKIKGGNLVKLVAFFVIAAVLTCTASFAANGWQSFVDKEPDSDNADGNLPDGEVDENTDGNTGGGEQVVVPAPEFYHYLTGLTVSAEESNERPLAFIYGGGEPNYGFSAAQLAIEIPVENGNTRTVAFISASEYLGKIGSIAPTRDYMTSIVGSFGGLLIHKGNDDSFEYGDSVRSDGLDLCENQGYSYTEYNSYHFSNGDLVAALLKNTGASTVKPTGAIAPYLFNEKGAHDIVGADSAITVTIPYSDTNTTELVYEAMSGKYTLHKGGEAVKDLLNDKTCEYVNAFILYADSTTYETAEATETVIDTSGSGVGYYFTRGSAIKISWSMEGGSLVFRSEDGRILTVNRGSSYIAFERSSRINNTVYN